MTPRRQPVLVVLPLVALGLVACGSDSPCERTGPCPNDRQLSESEQRDCKAKVAADECESELVSYANCALDHRVCGADQKSDVRASTAATASACAEEQSAYIKCLYGSSGGSGGSYGGGNCGGGRFSVASDRSIGTPGAPGALALGVLILAAARRARARAHPSSRRRRAGSPFDEPRVTARDLETPANRHGAERP